MRSSRQSRSSKSYFVAPAGRILCREASERRGPQTGNPYSPAYGRSEAKGRSVSRRKTGGKDSGMGFIRTSLPAAVLLLCSSACAWAGTPLMGSGPYVGEPRGILTLSIGFGLIVLQARRRRHDSCEVVDIRPFLSASSAAVASSEDSVAAEVEPTEFPIAA